MKTKETFLTTAVLAALLFFTGSSLLHAQDQIIGNDTESNQNKNVIQVIENSGNHTIFVSLLEEVQAYNLLQEDGPYTILAPTDDAFENVNVDSLRQEDEALRDFIYAHLLQGKYPASDVEYSMNVVIREGDLKATNGIVHFLDEVLKTTGK